MTTGRWVVWLPVAVAFGTAITVAGLGLDGVLASPGSIALSFVIVFIGILQGLVVGFVAVVVANSVDKLVRGPLSGWILSAKILLQVLAVGLIVGTIVWVYVQVAAPRADLSRPLAPVFIVGIVAAVSAGLWGWQTIKQTRTKPGSTD